MASAAPSDVQQKRLLRMTIAHYRKEECSEEDFYTWTADVYSPQAVKIFTKHGLEGYTLHMSPSSFRGAAIAMNAARGNRWTVRDHDFQIEFYFRDPAVFGNIGKDPEFQALQSTHGPYVSRIHTEASIGWVETYVQDGKAVNLSEDGKSEYLGWAAMSAAPQLGGPKPATS